MKKHPPEILNQIVDVVLAYHPQRKKKKKAVRNKKEPAKRQQKGRT